MPALTYNLGVNTVLEEKEIKENEKLQSEVSKKMVKLPTVTKSVRITIAAFEAFNVGEKKIKRKKNS